MKATKQQAALNALSSLIKKGRVLLYKPIQIAEILYRDRVKKDIDLEDVETYRNKSKHWRNIISKQFTHTQCSSSSIYQDNLFNDNAIPPSILKTLGEMNRKSSGGIEGSIYKAYLAKQSQVAQVLEYCLEATPTSFSLLHFLESFSSEVGLKRSIDKIFEIVVYALFETIVTNSNLKISIFIDGDNSLLESFPDFSKKILGLSSSNKSITLDAHFHRVGVTNASDRGLDMVANFGSVIQIKHLDLSESVAQGVLDSVTMNRIVIVCKSADAKIIDTVLSQVGFKDRIQAIISIEELNDWYGNALRGEFKSVLAQQLLDTLSEQIMIEFPTLGNDEFTQFLVKRNYTTLQGKWRNLPA